MALNVVSNLVKYLNAFIWYVVGPSKQASIHMHVCNVVTLGWGLLRLAPIMAKNVSFKHHRLVGTINNCISGWILSYNEPQLSENGCYALGKTRSCMWSVSVWRLLLNRLPTPNEAGLLALLCKKHDRSCTYSSDLMTRQEDEDSFIFHVAVGKYIQPTIALHASMVKKTKTAW